MAETPSHRRQVVGSLVAAVLLVMLTVALVTAKIGPGLDSSELREKEERQEGGSSSVRSDARKDGMTRRKDELVTVSGRSAATVGKSPTRAEEAK